MKRELIMWMYNIEEKNLEEGLDALCKVDGFIHLDGPLRDNKTVKYLGDLHLAFLEYIKVMKKEIQNLESKVSCLQWDLEQLKEELENNDNDQN